MTAPYDTVALANGSLAYMLVFVRVLRLMADANKSFDELDPAMKGKKMKYLLTRLIEPSSYAGIGAVATGILSLTHGADLSTGLASILGGLFAFILPEGKTAA